MGFTLSDLLPFVLIGGVFVWTRKKGEGKNKKQALESPKAYLIPFSMLIVVVAFLAASYFLAEWNARLESTGSGEALSQLALDIWRVGCVISLVVGTALGLALSALQVAALRRHGLDGIEITPSPAKLLANLGWSPKIGTWLVALFCWLPFAGVPTGFLIFALIPDTPGQPPDEETIYAGIERIRYGMIVAEVFTLYLATITAVPILVGYSLTIRWLNSKGRHILEGA